jgi:hypothetical protein
MASRNLKRDLAAANVPKAEVIEVGA